MHRPTQRLSTTLRDLCYMQSCLVSLLVTEGVIWLSEEQGYTTRVRCLSDFEVDKLLRQPSPRCTTDLYYDLLPSGTQSDPITQNSIPAL